MANILSEWYGIMPNKVLYCKELTDKQKLLYCLVSSLCAEKWYCRASNEYLWELLNAEKGTISKNIWKLIEKWLITTELESWFQRKISLVENDIPLVKNDKGGSQKWLGGVVKNDNIILQYNNTNEYLFSAYYWKRKWIDGKVCDKLISNILNQWITLEEIRKWMALYNCECWLKQEWRYVKKLETWLKEFQPLSESDIEQWIRNIARAYKQKINTDTKFQNSSIAKIIWEELISVFDEQKVREIWKSEWRKQVTLNLS